MSPAPRTRSSWGLAAWMPSRKWWATQVTALTALALMWVTTDSWDQEETIALIGVVSQAALSWLVPNDPAQLRRDAERGTTLVEALIVVFIIVAILLVLFRLL